MSSLANETLADESNEEFDREEDIEIAMNVAFFSAWLAACTVVAAGMGTFAWRKFQGGQAREVLLASEPLSEYQQLPGVVTE